MTITVEVDFCKENISDFGELAKAAFQYAMAFGREMVRRIVEERDAELRKNRDTDRYVNKGKRKTCLKTLLGDVEFERTVYIDEPKPLSASKTPLTTGKGYECWSRASVPNLPWLKSVKDYQSLAEIHLS